MERFYLSCIRLAEKSPSYRFLLILLCKFSPIGIAVIYLGLGILLAFQRDIRIWCYLISPMLCLLVVKGLRIFIQRKRPFEKYQFKPVIGHDTGCSFPSKHAASAAVICVACWYIHFPLGVFIAVLAFLAGATRILTGIHYISDVVSGWGLGCSIGLLGCWLL
ncbi:phosphatase PAP2 family protein [Clostridium facile]|uniref:Phosphatase PAP2 family protein n=1 Tax=Clostridium facile TaxID=2763035 RepID=A0ABR7IS50_9CLOT|nr:phosphatase PAP2 family protein [Clostridium facile]MBC5787908.1 phosphatase PAP2 family protein [Clostridium facile]